MLLFIDHLIVDSMNLFILPAAGLSTLNTSWTYLCLFTRITYGKFVRVFLVIVIGLLQMLSVEANVRWIVLDSGCASQWRCPAETQCALVSKRRIAYAKILSPFLSHVTLGKLFRLYLGSLLCKVGIMILIACTINVFW